ncbi:MAG: asparagine synthetase B [Desulfoferrobacter sp.]
MEAVFGVLHRDPRSQVEENNLLEFAKLLGITTPSVFVNRGFGLCLNRKVIDSRAQNDSVAVSDDRLVWLAMTGEIESREAMLSELERTKYPARGTKDADALLGMFLVHGASFIERVHGFFNIVVWDARRHRLFLYADRCGGIRPLYYHLGREVFLFGSCAKVVIAHTQVPREIDLMALEELLVLAHPIAPRTLFKGVSVLLAGTFIEYGGGEVRIYKYWKRQPYRSSGMDLQQLEEQYFAALEPAVLRSMDATAETGVLLSGGVDSAALISLLHRAGHRRLKTFTINIGDSERNDQEASKFIADRYQTKHHVIEQLDEKCLDNFPEMIWYYESPGVNFHPTYLLCREARKHCDLLIGGYGNDLIWGVLTPLHSFERWLSDFTPVLSILRYLRCRRGIGRNELRKLKIEADPTDIGLLTRIARFAQRTRHPLTDQICLDESLFGDQRVFLELGKFVIDAHDHWIRAPYSDFSVVNIAEKVPPDDRYRRKADGSLELKSFFKDLMLARQILPPEIIYRSKTWMQSPTVDWLRGRLGRTFEAILLSRSARERGYFNMARVKQLVCEHRAAVADNTYQLMMLTGLEIWHRIFIDSPSLAEAQLDLSDHSRQV